jgi:hypothetical protein
VIFLGFKENLSRAIHGSPEERKRKALLKKRERTAYLESYEKARVVRAKAKGREAGRTTTTQRLKRGVSALESTLGGLGDLGSSYDPFGLGDTQPRRRKPTKKTGKGTVVTTIKVDGTTIKISKKKRRRRKR